MACRETLRFAQNRESQGKAVRLERSVFNNCTVVLINRRISQTGISVSSDN